MAQNYIKNCFATYKEWTKKLLWCSQLHNESNQTYLISSISTVLSPDNGNKRTIQESKFQTAQHQKKLMLSYDLPFLAVVLYTGCSKGVLTKL